MRGLGNDFKTAPRSTFDIVYEKNRGFVLFQSKEGQYTMGAVLNRKIDRRLIIINRVYKYSNIEYGDALH